MDKDTTRDRVIALYLAMLAAHMAHVLEEVYGRFWMMDAVFGAGWFCAVNVLLFCVPLAVFYYFLRGGKASAYCALGYAAVMLLNGIGHNVMTLVTGRYFHGYAGCITGVALICLSLPMIYYLRRMIRAARPIVI
jgi:hypothetical protein